LVVVIGSLHTNSLFTFTFFSMFCGFCSRIRGMRDTHYVIDNCF